MTILILKKTKKPQVDVNTLTLIWIDIVTFEGETKELLPNKRRQKASFEPQIELQDDDEKPLPAKKLKTQQQDHKQDHNKHQPQTQDVPSDDVQLDDIQIDGIQDDVIQIEYIDI